MFTSLKKTRYMQYLAAITANLSCAAAGMYVYWTSPALPILQSDNSPLGRPISDEEGSWVVSLNKLGNIFAAIMGGWFVERIGRKNALLASGVLLLLPWFLIIFAKSLWLIYIARFIFGIAGGILSIGCSIYNGEIADNNIRGKLGSGFIILKLAGSLIVLCVGPYVSYTTLAIISAIVPALFLCTYVFMPESPYYLMKVNKSEAAEKNLRVLSGKGVDDKFIKGRMEEIERVVTEDMQNKTSLWELLSNREYRNAIIIMMGIKALQPLSGGTAIESYMQTIIGLSSSNISEEVSSIIFGFVQLPAALVAGLLVDKFGRKPLLLISLVGCAIALFAEGIFFYCQDALEVDITSIAWIPTVGIAVYVIMSPLGIATLPYVLLGELFPTNIKGIAVSASVCYGSILAFVVQKYFKPLANIWGIYTVFWIFGVFCVLGVFFIITMLPETKGKTFVEIQKLLKKDKPKDGVENTTNQEKISSEIC